MVGAGSRNFMTYWSQLLYKEAQRGAAIEILNRVQVDGEAADREAARLRMAGSCPPHLGGYVCTSDSMKACA